MVPFAISFVSFWSSIFSKQTQTAFFKHVHFQSLCSNYETLLWVIPLHLYCKHCICNSAFLNILYYQMFFHLCFHPLIATWSGCDSTRVQQNHLHSDDILLDAQNRRRVTSHEVMRRRVKIRITLLFLDTQQCWPRQSSCLAVDWSSVLNTGYSSENTMKRARSS